MKLSLRAFATAACLCVAVAPSVARADPSPADVSLARDQFRAGLDAAGAGRWEQAREAFARAYALYPRPLTLLDLAGAQAHTRRFVEAAENYRRFLREATTPPASDHREEAERTMQAMEARIAHVRLRIGELHPGDVVRLDGVAISGAAVGVPYPVNPGQHEAAVERDGAALLHTSFDVDEGGSRDVTMVVPRAAPPVPAPVAAPEPKGAAPAPWLQPSPAQPAKTSEGGLLSSPWFWTAAGVVVVGGAATAGALLLHSSAPPPAYAGNVPPSHVVVP